MSTPFQTPTSKKSKSALNGGAFGTPMFVPPTPMLQSLGYGTGVEVYRIERSPLTGGCTRSPWALKRVTRQGERDATAAATYKRRLADEADILRQLDHPNIVGFRGIRANQDGRAALAMELCDTSLGNLLEARHERDDGALPAAHIRRVCVDMFAALDYLHTRVRLLHADIKSYNVLVKDEFAVCKLCDFGVSLPLTADGFVDVVRKPDARYIGTDLWCAPEALVATELASVGTKSDVFSMGLVIYECVALIPPHTWALAGDEEEEEDEDDMDEEDDEGMDVDLLCGTRPPMPESADLGPEYNVIVELFYVCTNADPDDRPSAGSLVKMLSGTDTTECGSELIE